ncbi:hypothetical protein NDI43_20610 [Microcoleus vaginatus GB2-A3]|uniref:hypothetical protein n=1 Tax=Microcoleus vaginatus TaxID=119532 RepID=UPI0016858EC9|nr:hypothetical protein [Microcoleus sp. FACHB-61]
MRSNPTLRFAQHFYYSDANGFDISHVLYEGMNIRGATGLTNAQKATLKALGALI